MVGGTRCDKLSHRNSPTEFSSDRRIFIWSERSLFVSLPPTSASESIGRGDPQGTLATPHGGISRCERALVHHVRHVRKTVLLVCKLLLAR